MDDIPWIYVAMIFIAFISWLRGRIQDAAAVRRQRAADRKAKSRSRRTTEPEYESPYSAKNRTSEPEAPQTFTRILKEIESQINETEEPPPQPQPRVEPQQGSAAPPPLPSSEPSYQPTEIPVPVTPSAPVQRRKRARKFRVPNNSQVDSLTASLSHGSKLRTALILKEVLDKPRALQPRR